MHLITKALPEAAKPRKSCVRGLRDLALNVKMKDRLGTTSQSLGHALPLVLSSPATAGTRPTKPDVINPYARLICGPMFLEVIQEVVP